MIVLISAALRFIQHNVFLLALIVLAMLSASTLQREWNNIDTIVHALPALSDAVGDVSRRQADLVGDTQRQVERLAGAPVRRLDAEILKLDQEIAALSKQASAAIVPNFSAPASIAGTLRQRALLELNIQLRQQARDHLLALRARGHALVNREAAIEKLEQLRRAHRHAYADIGRAQVQLQQLDRDEGWLARIPGTATNRRLKELEAAKARLVAANNRAYRQALAQQTLLSTLPKAGAVLPFQIDERRLAAATAPLREQLARAESIAAENWVWKFHKIVSPVLPAALGMLLVWWAVPPLIRTFCYFVLAPWAARRPAMLIGKADGQAAAGGRPGQDRSRISAVSQEVTLAPGHEMLIRPDYCQRLDAGLKVTTTLLFNWRFWLTSIAAHLWMLNRIQATDAASVVVSSTGDPLDEVALLEIGPGSAFVLQPRALVGVLYQQGGRPVIRSHWRLGTLHAWLTFQLRYLVFEGPCTLVVKGCRGVRLESAGDGRTVSQWATLGFSTDTQYATVRAEPFLPYLRDTQPLFHDKFVGPSGCYLYEETPSRRLTDRRGRNPLEMLFDAGLKALGI